MPDPAAPRTVRVTVECVKTSHTLMGQPIAPHLTTRLCVFCGAPEFAPPGVILATLADPAAEALMADGLKWRERHGSDLRPPISIDENGNFQWADPDQRGDG